MNCATFREALDHATLTAEELAHMRRCSACLEMAVAADPDNLFRSLGGEVIPPGGVDLFAEEVMQQVHLRETEEALGTRTRFPAVYRWSLAAALMIAVIGVALLPIGDTPAPTRAVQVPHSAPVPVALASLPAVESYEESNAMIVELPAEETGDLKVVMIFDETLPADL